jgi:hypothetical protein
MKISAAGSTITIEYHEPTTNVDGSVIDDLDHTSIYVGGVKIKDVPASAKTGGGLITESFDSGVGTGQEDVLLVDVTAWDGSGNESAHVSFNPIRIDTLAPSPPLL